MPKLSGAHKRLVVMRLATFVSPSEIVDELKEQGVIASFQQVTHYDPTYKGSDVGREWRELYAETRAQFIANITDIPIANKAYRVRELDDMARASKRKNNYVLAAALHEQAAKEMGEAYTNRRIVEAADPAAALAVLLGVSVDELSAAVAGVGASAS